jgi:hypothetical protein
MEKPKTFRAVKFFFDMIPPNIKLKGAEPRHLRNPPPSGHPSPQQNTPPSGHTTRYELQQTVFFK